MNLKYQIKIKSLHKESIKLYTNFLEKILKRIRVEFSIVNLPKKKNRITLLKSSHVNKSAREQFEIRTHKRIIDVYQPTDTTLENLKNLDISAGVDVEVKNF